LSTLGRMNTKFNTYWMFNTRRLFFENYSVAREENCL